MKGVFNITKSDNERCSEVLLKAKEFFVSAFVTLLAVRNVRNVMLVHHTFKNDFDFDDFVKSYLGVVL